MEFSFIIPVSVLDELKGDNILSYDIVEFLLFVQLCIRS